MVLKRTVTVCGDMQSLSGVQTHWCSNALVLKRTVVLKRAVVLKRTVAATWLKRSWSASLAELLLPLRRHEEHL